MITNKKNAATVFSVFLIIWFILLSGIVCYFLLIRRFDFGILIYFTFILFYSMGFYRITCDSIDASGLGITYSSQPYVFKALNSNLCAVRKEISYQVYQNQSVEEKCFYRLSVILKNKQNNQHILLNLMFFDKKMKSKLNHQLTIKYE